MSGKSKQYISETAIKLKDPEYAAAYMNAAIINHDEPFQVALAGMIDKFGHSELAVLIDMKPNNLALLVKDLSNDVTVKHETLERLLDGFGLTLNIVVKGKEAQGASK